MVKPNMGDVWWMLSLSYARNNLVGVRAASAGRNAKRQDPEEGLGPEGEHAVGATGGETPKHSHPSGYRRTA